MQKSTMLVLSLSLAGLIIVTSCTASLTPDFYSLESLNWQVQSIGQDMVDLFFIVPCLIISSILAHKNNRHASMFRAGVLLYLIYTYALYCFELHFNKLFVLYCITLGLSFYLLLYFFLIQIQRSSHVTKHFQNHSAIRFIGIYFIVISVVFYLLWLSEIIPALIQNIKPKSLVDTGLFTNGVQVLDLSIFLPGIFITGIFLLRKISLGLVLTPIILTFFILMDITIGVLNVVMKVKQIESGVFVSIIMILLALISVTLLIWFFKTVKSTESF